MQNGACQREQIQNVLLVFQRINLNRLVRNPRVPQCGKNGKNVRTASDQDRDFTPIGMFFHDSNDFLRFRFAAFVFEGRDQLRIGSGFRSGRHAGGKLDGSPPNVVVTHCGRESRTGPVDNFRGGSKVDFQAERLQAD